MADIYAGMRDDELRDDEKYSETPYAIEQMVEALHKADQDIAERIQRRHKLFDRLQESTANLNRVVQERSDWFEGQVRCNPVPDRDMGVAVDPRRY